MASWASCLASLSSEFALLESRMTIRIDVAVTPRAVAPPLSAPAGHAMTQRGMRLHGTRTRPVFGSQLGFASASCVSIPGYFAAVDSADPAAAGAAVAALAGCVAVGPRAPVARADVTDAPPAGPAVAPPVAASAPGVAPVAGSVVIGSDAVG